MISFEKSIFINLPTQDVFDVVTDPSKDSQWRPSTVSSEWISDGPVGVGSTKKEAGKVMGRQVETTAEVTHWDPPNLYGTKSAGGPIPFETMLAFASKDNGTLLTISGQAEMGGFFKLAEGLAGKQLEKQMDADLRRLKALLESGQN